MTLLWFFWTNPSISQNWCKYPVCLPELIQPIGHRENHCRIWPWFTTTKTSCAEPTLILHSHKSQPHMDRVGKTLDCTWSQHGKQHGGTCQGHHHETFTDYIWDSTVVMYFNRVPAQGFNLVNTFLQMELWVPLVEFIFPLKLDLLLLVIVAMVLIK